MKSIDITYEADGITYYAYMDVSNDAAEVLTGPDIDEVNGSYYGIALRKYLEAENYLMENRIQNVVLIAVEENNELTDCLNVVNGGSKILSFK